MSTYLVHTQYEISRDQQVFMHGVGSDSEVHNLHVINQIEIEFYISWCQHTSCTNSIRSREISKCVCTGSYQIQKCIIYMLLIELRLNFTFPDVNIPRAHTVWDLARSASLFAWGRIRFRSALFTIYKSNWVWILHFLMSTYLLHTQYEISRDQQLCVHGVGSDSEVHNLHVINRIEIEFNISWCQHTSCTHSMRSR